MDTFPQYWRQLPSFSGWLYLLLQHSIASLVFTGRTYESTYFSLILLSSSELPGTLSGKKKMKVTHSGSKVLLILEDFNAVLNWENKLSFIFNCFIFTWTSCASRLFVILVYTRSVNKVLFHIQLYRREHCLLGPTQDCLLFKVGKSSTSFFAIPFSAFLCVIFKTLC